MSTTVLIVNDNHIGELVRFVIKNQNADTTMVPIPTEANDISVRLETEWVEIKRLHVDDGIHVPLKFQNKEPWQEKQPHRRIKSKHFRR